MLARLGNGIEQKFPSVRDGDADHRRLGGTLRGHARLNRPGLGTHVGQQLRWIEGVVMFAHVVIVPDRWVADIVENRCPMAADPYNLSRVGELYTVVLAVLVRRKPRTTA